MIKPTGTLLTTHTSTKAILRQIGIQTNITSHGNWENLSQLWKTPKPPLQYQMLVRFHGTWGTASTWDSLFIMSVISISHSTPLADLPLNTQRETEEETLSPSLPTLVWLNSMLSGTQFSTNMTSILSSHWVILIGHTSELNQQDSPQSTLWAPFLKWMLLIRLGMMSLSKLLSPSFTPGSLKILFPQQPIWRQVSTLQKDRLWREVIDLPFFSRAGGDLHQLKNQLNLMNFSPNS